MNQLSFLESELVLTPHQIIDKALSQYPEIAAMLVLFSGGNDSLVMADIATAHPFFKTSGKVIHINTGIGIPQTNEFARETAKARGWRFIEYKAVENVDAKGNPDPQIYEDMVIAHGFPGARQHSTMYQMLKERQVNRAIRDLKLNRNQKVLLVSGIRQQESARRMGWAEVIHRDKKKDGKETGRRVWVNPCFYYSKADINRHRQENKLPINTVSQMICMSGECLCGAFAKPGELALIEACFPDVGCRLRALEQKVNAAGFPWGWESSPPKAWLNEKRGQKQIPGMDDFLPLCASCVAQKTSLDSLEIPQRWEFETVEGTKIIECYSNRPELALTQFNEQFPGLEPLKGRHIVRWKS